MNLQALRSLARVNIWIRDLKSYIMHRIRRVISTQNRLVKAVASAFTVAVLSSTKKPKARKLTSAVLDEQSQSDTIPAIVVKNDNIDLGHEASIGRISDDAIFYLMSRGLSEDEARAMLVRGFVEPVSKALPLEYAVEMNNLINLELKGSLK